VIGNSHFAAQIAAANSRDRLEAAERARLAAQARPRRKLPALRGRLSARRRPAAQQCLHPRPTR
jgi:hypothetical protein